MIILVSPFLLLLHVQSLLLSSTLFHSPSLSLTLFHSFPSSSNPPSFLKFTFVWESVYLISGCFFMMKQSVHGIKLLAKHLQTWQIANWKWQMLVMIYWFEIFIFYSTPPPPGQLNRLFLLIQRLLLEILIHQVNKLYWDLWMKIMLFLETPKTSMIGYSVQLGILIRAYS